MTTYTTVGPPKNLFTLGFLGGPTVVYVAIWSRGLKLVHSKILLNTLIGAEIWVAALRFLIIHFIKSNVNIGLKREKIQLVDVSAFDNVVPLRSPLNVGFLDYFYCRIIGISNGVLGMLDYLLEYRSRVVLWHPSLSRCLTLAMTPLSCDNSRTYTFVLGFDFAINTRDYKVTRMYYARGDGQYLLPPRVDIYGLSWGISKDFDGSIPDICVVEYFSTQVEICGEVQWTAYKRNREKRVEYLIVMFDLN